MTDQEKPIYNFVLPDAKKPVGGMNVLYEMAETLQENGYSVRILHEQKHYRYPYYPSTVPVAYSLMRQTPLVWRPRQIVRRIRHIWSDLRKRDANPSFVPNENDVFVLPDFMYSQYARLYSNGPHILIAQDVFGFFNAYTHDMKLGGKATDGLGAVITTSNASHSAVRTVMGEIAHQVTLAIHAAPLVPQEPKKLQIAYMPRKRADEAAFVVEALRRHLGADGVSFVPIEGVSDAERNAILRESLFFLSFSQKEGFGLPPAEAMAAECLVVGYTGVGGNEYFTAETGFPIEDSDISAFVATVQDLVGQYRQDPEPLDRIRMEAAMRIRRVYTQEAFRRSLLTAWDAIDRQIASRTGPPASGQGSVRALSDGRTDPGRGQASA